MSNRIIDSNKIVTKFQFPMETVYLKDSETGRVYEISAAADEAKRLRTDIVYATTKLGEIKKIHKENNTIVFDIDNCEEISQKDDEISQEEISQDETSQHATSEEVGVFKWPYEAILLLIEEYNLRQNYFYSGKMSQKKVWSLIAAELVKHSYNVTGPQCLSKFSGLKRTYKAVKDHNSKSGNGTKKWPYFSHMDNLLGSKPFMLPVSTVSSTRKRSRSPSECSTSSRSSDSCSEIEEKSVCEKVGQLRKKVRQLHNVEKLIEDIKSDRKIPEEAMERRHQENIDLRKRLLDSLGTMVDILQKK